MAPETGCIHARVYLCLCVGVRTYSSLLACQLLAWNRQTEPNHTHTQPFPFHCSGAYTATQYAAENKFSRLPLATAWTAKRAWLYHGVLSFLFFSKQRESKKGDEKFCFPPFVRLNSSKCVCVCICAAFEQHGKAKRNSLALTVAGVVCCRTLWWVFGSNRKRGNRFCVFFSLPFSLLLRPNAFCTANAQHCTAATSALWIEKCISSCAGIGRR